MINTLAILYTMKCTASCRICCFDCTPQRTEKISVNQAKSYIDKALSFGTITTVGFSGGEALLYIDEICELAQYATSKGINKISVNTNGFWGTTRENAVTILSKLRDSGVAKIGLSSDDYHQEFVPAENIKNILDASAEFNISIDLGVMISRESRRLPQVVSHFGDKITNKVIMEYPVLSVGQAKENNISSPPANLNFDNSLKCYNLKYLAVYPNGDIYPCCSQLGRNNSLKIGNMNTDTVEQIKKNYNSNMFIRILTKYGFKWFVDRKPQYNQKYVSICDLCSNLIGDEVLFDENFGTDINLEKERIYNEYIKKHEVVSQ